MIERLAHLVQGGDASLPLAVAAMLSVAEESGRLTFDDLAVAYRRDYLDLQRAEFGDTFVKEWRKLPLAVWDRCG